MPDEPIPVSDVEGFQLAEGFIYNMIIDAIAHSRSLTEQIQKLTTEYEATVSVLKQLHSSHQVLAKHARADSPPDLVIEIAQLEERLRSVCQ